MFTDDEEEALSTYLITSSKMFHGLTRLATSTLSEMERHDHLHANKMAGIDWLHGFLKRRNELGLWMPEATSLSRATSFNVSQIFDNFETVICRHAYEPRQIWNLD